MTMKESILQEIAYDDADERGNRLEESAADVAAIAASVSVIAGLGTFGLTAYKTFVDHGRDEMDALRAQLDDELAEMRAQQAADMAELRRMGYGFGPEDDSSDWY